MILRFPVVGAKLRERELGENDIENKTNFESLVYMTGRYKA